MDMKATFVATLLGCTMLAGCNGSDSATKTTPAASGTFGTVAAKPNTAVTPAAASKADLDALKQDNATALNSVSVVQDAKFDSLKQDRAKALESLDAKRAAELDALRQNNAVAMASLDAKELSARAKNWTNIFDDNVGRMKLSGKNMAGDWSYQSFDEGTEAHYL
jgi:hypothetical protein